MTRLSAKICRCLSLLLTLCGLLSPLCAEAGGTWIQVASPPHALTCGLLLSDGTVLCHDSAATYYKLVPDIHGSYVNGTWIQAASSTYSRLYYSSDVLTNGNVYTAGAEYGTGGTNAELYNTVLNTWTTIPQPTNVPYLSYLDACSKILPNGNVLQGDSQSDIYIYNAAANIITTNQRSGDNGEACWVRLPNDNILTVTTFGPHSEHYVPSLNAWYADGDAPVSLYNSSVELGAALVLPNGKVFQIGGTTNTAIYTPGSSLTGAGTWVAGPVMVFGTNQLGADDAPAAMMVNGNILMALGPITNYVGPTTFYEYNYIANTITQVSTPTGGTDGNAPYAESMLDLPDGTVLLFDGGGTGLYVYKPDGTPLAAGQPSISSITQNGDGSYHLTGIGLNGISGGAAYGDDEQMDSSYPLVRLTNSSSGNVYYARTFGWSSTTIQNPNPVTTEFTVPASLPAGTYSLVVVANGNASAPTNFTYGAAATPSIPTGVTATPGINQVSLGWIAATNSPTGYNVKRGAAAAGPFTAIGSTTAPTVVYTDSVLGGQAYYYVVSAVNGVIMVGKTPCGSAMQSSE